MYDEAYSTGAGSAPRQGRCTPPETVSFFHSPVGHTNRRVGDSRRDRSLSRYACPGGEIEEIWSSDAAYAADGEVQEADESGNLIFRKTARNFNQPMVTAAKICIAEVEEVVPTGSLDPNTIHLPGIYVKRLIVGGPYDKKIEFRTVRQRGAA